MLSKIYQPDIVEPEIYELWRSEKSFIANNSSSKPPFVIVMPPPNITGILHMGHALQGCIQDVIIRMKRMQGYEVAWIPGTDHAGIATQNVVARYIKKEKKKTLEEIGREKFMEYVWEWNHKYGKIITEQYQRLGVSCDWSRECFTMDKERSEAVFCAFQKLHEAKLIYRGPYIVNWCPQDKTTLSNEEVKYEERKGTLWYVRYFFHKTDKKESQYIDVATTRPETIPGDTAIAVHPEDERYKSLVGKYVEVPIIKRVIPIIADGRIDAKFGTGALKVTPAHSKNDFDIGASHGLPTVNIMNEDATLNEKAGPIAFLERFSARDKMVNILKEQGHLLKEEPIVHNISLSSRSYAVIEHRISTQWFVRMKPLAEQSLHALSKQEYKFYPMRWKNEYKRWMDDIHDWAISRQLWWGHRIPVWYYVDEQGNIDTEKEYIIAREQPDDNMVQDPDVLDTWFSSWLWPFSTMGWPKDTKDMQAFYPNSLLVSGYDILFFWIARMIMSGLFFVGKVPFKEILLTGMIKDKYGRWMSKSLGNGIDPVDMVSQYGADAVRYSLISLCGQGQDIKLDKTKFELGRNFVNKLWNAFRFLSIHLSNKHQNMTYQVNKNALIDQWMVMRIENTLRDINMDMKHYRINEMLQKLHVLFWDEYCAWYLEVIKPDYGKKMTDIQILSACTHFKTILCLLHPFIPYITEQIWQLFPGQKESKNIIHAPWPKVNKYNYSVEENTFQSIRSIVSCIRMMRTTLNISRHVELNIQIVCPDDKKRNIMINNEYIFHKLDKIKQLSFFEGANLDSQWVPCVFEGGVVYIYVSGIIDREKEKKRLQIEAQRTEKLNKAAEKKLENENFIAKAPEEIIIREQNKLKDSKQKLDFYHELIARL